MLKDNNLLKKNTFKPGKGKRNFATKTQILNEYDFFPLNNKRHNLVRGIVAVDIETMKMEGSTNQLPALLSLAYYKNGIVLKKFFIIDYKLVINKGYEYAAKEM